MIQLFLILFSLSAANASDFKSDLTDQMHFVGCRTTPSECRYSCPTKQWFAKGDKKVCDPFLNPFEPFACYCIVSEENNVPDKGI